MIWLALDTATDVATFAVKVGDTCYVREQEGVSTHAQMCLPFIDELLKQANIGLQDLNGIILGRGPGSFTGLRVACAVAKGLAFVHDTPIYALSNLEVVACMAREKYPNRSILSLIDARMRQVYWAHYHPGQLHAEEHVSCISEINLTDDKDLVLTGFNYDEYLHLLPEAFCNTEKLSLRVGAQDMITMVESGNYSPISAQALEPHYVRDKVTHGS